jgi:hypothetical protein
MPVHQWSDRAFAFKGDLVHGQLPSVDFDTSYLHQVNGQQSIPTANGMSQLLAGDPTLALVGPFANGEQGPRSFARAVQCMYHPAMCLSSLLRTYRLELDTNR